MKGHGKRLSQLMIMLREANRQEEEMKERLDHWKKMYQFVSRTYGLYFERLVCGLSNET